MSRKKFIESMGATCKNWYWSWSFINEKEKFIIFGCWDVNTQGNISLILNRDWEKDRKGKRPPGYSQAIEHIELVRKHGYALKTFPMEYSEQNINEDSATPVIKSFIPELTEKKLIKIGAGWYASDNKMTDQSPEEVISPSKYIEGKLKKVYVNKYERDNNARIKCIEHYGYECFVCGFDFEKFYGDIGVKYIHVHHKVPVAEIKKTYEVDPIADLVPLCPNCHAMVHRTTPPLKIEQLVEILQLDGSS